MPASARKHIVDEKTVGTYHCINRCVRRAFLCGDDPLSGKNYDHRKQWVKDRLEHLSEIFFADIGNYAIMSNHFHISLRTRPDLAKKCSDDDIVDRWWKLFPRKIRGSYEDHCPQYLREQWLGDKKWLKQKRRRLASISWLMRCLAEYIARRANKEDGVTGRFWEGRFKSQALLTDAAVLAAGVYIDLNPIRAGIADTLEKSDFTSIQQRVEDSHSQSKKPYSFLARFKGASDLIEGEAPFLMVDEKDYIAICTWYASRPNDQENPSAAAAHGLRVKDLSELEQLMRDCPAALGSAEARKRKAASAGRKWFRGNAATRRAF